MHMRSRVCVVPSGLLAMLAVAAILGMLPGRGAAAVLSPFGPQLQLAAREDCIPFNPAQAAVQQIGGRWKVTVGNMWLLDFDTREADARKALSVIQHYGMNSQCFVGRPNAPMQYYLVNGGAPVGPMAGEDAIPFNPNNIQAQQVNGTWKVVEGTSHWMLDFGANGQANANTAVSIIKHYGFDHIAFVGRPNPNQMMYFYRAAAAPPAPTAGKEDCIPFSPSQATVQQIGGRWKIVVGNMWLLDFENREADARKALQIIQHYGMNSQCFVGRGGAAMPMQYYLVNGAAPVGAFPGEDAIPINPNNVQAQQINGTWKVVDGNNWLLDFGAGGQNDAQTAAAIIRKYQFDHMCFVGRASRYIMMYFRRGGPGSTTTTPKEDCIPFNPAQAAVQQIGGRWKVTVGNMWLLDFDTREADARKALSVIQHYGMNSQCFVGRPNAPMQYYLVNGGAPVGPMAGEDAIPFNPNNIQAQQVNGTWKVVEGTSHWMLDFGANGQANAQTAVDIIKHYGFTYMCFVGRPNKNLMMYFRK